MSRPPSPIPAAEQLFAPTQDAYGSRLALVFGNESPTGACPFYRVHCYHCDIGAGEGIFTPAMNLQRLEFYQTHYRGILEQTRHLVLYNSGSMLNPHEMSAATLTALLACVRSLAGCRMVSFDSREMFVTRTALRQIHGQLRPDQQLRITLGLETQDDHARTVVLHKNMSRAGIEKAFATIGAFGQDVGVDLNLVFQLPGIAPGQAIAEASQTFAYGLALGEKFGVPVDFNFHPYYPSASGQRHFPRHPRSLLTDAIAALTQGCQQIQQHGGRAKIFIGWHDEGHDQEASRRQDETRFHLAGFLAFNQSQDPAPLMHSSAAPMLAPPTDN